MVRYAPDRHGHFAACEQSDLCFGGVDLRTLYITTAANPDAEATGTDTLAGGLFAVEGVAQGRRRSFRHLKSNKNQRTARHLGG